MKEVKNEYQGKAIVKTVIVDENDENYKLATKYKITVVPTLVFINADGSEYKRVEGFTAQKDIKEIFSKMGVK